MGEARHTDGPWEIEEDDAGRYIVGSDGETIAMLLEDVMDDEQREADARLIAASPDLFEACVAFVGAVVVEDDGRHVKLDPREVLAALRRASLAIRKATGEAP